MAKFCIRCGRAYITRRSVTSVNFTDGLRCNQKSSDTRNQTRDIDLPAIMDPRRGESYRTFRGQFARKHVYDKSFGIIGRTVEDRR